MSIYRSIKIFQLKYSNEVKLIRRMEREMFSGLLIK